MAGEFVSINDAATPAAETWRAAAEELAHKADSLADEIAACTSNPWWGSDSAATTAKDSVRQLTDLIHGPDYHKATHAPIDLGDAVLKAVDNSYASDQVQATVMKTVSRSIGRSTSR